MSDERKGEPGPRFQVYQCDLKGNPVLCVGKYRTIAEVRTHRWRRDLRYNVLVDWKPMSLIEFLAWAKRQEDM
jgi:hypothetical protein